MLSVNITVMRHTGQTQIYLTSARVARILGITKRTLHNWIKAGKIPGPEANPENGYLQWTMSDVEVARNVLTEETLDSTRDR
jgi:predicted site-specific integrase-resolvase